MTEQVSGSHDAAVAALRRSIVEERAHAVQWLHERHATAVQQQARIDAIGVSTGHPHVFAGWVS